MIVAPDGALATNIELSDTSRSSVQSAEVAALGTRSAPPIPPPRPPPRKKALCTMREGTLVTSASPPIIVIGPGGDHHIGFNAGICVPPDFAGASADGRDDNSERIEDASALSRRNVRSSTLQAVEASAEHPTGARRLRSGHLLYTHPEYHTAEWNKTRCLSWNVSCTRKEPLYFYLVAAIHLIFVTIHLAHGSGLSSRPSDIDLEVNSHTMGTLPVTVSLETYNITSIVLTLLGCLVVALQHVMSLNVYIAAAAVHLVIAMTQCTVFSTALRLIPHALLIAIAMNNRDKLSFTMIALDQVY